MNLTQAHRKEPHTSYPPLTPPPPRTEDMDPIEQAAAGEPPPDAAEWADRRVWGSPAVRRVVERVARAFEGTR